ncbi:hypothetical protein ACQKP0_14865 [Heyndrickxia sp. NPDC080065]|uniref:hypothetical protein n=1 Tax=Heyndrickxia sp. NPDC080065 TaxID=3390568 RepID=UPI003CFE4F85
MEYQFEVTFRIGKDNSTKDVKEINITDKIINMFGSLYGESQIIDLGNHFNLYHQYGKHKWHLSKGGKTAVPKSFPKHISINLEKKPGTSVSGNFGEVLTIFILKKLFLPKKLTICHLTSNRTCPDLILDSSVIDTYWSSKAPKYSLPPLPHILLGECKNTKFPEALNQLASIWYEMGPPPSNPLFGFGIISNLKYRTVPPKITFSIISPANDTALYNKLDDVANGRVKTTPTIKSMKLDDFKGGLLYGI